MQVNRTNERVCIFFKLKICLPTIKLRFNFLCGRKKYCIPLARRAMNIHVKDGEKKFERVAVRAN